MLRAMAQVREGALGIAGEGAQKAALMAQAKALGIESRVRFLGVRHDIPALLASASCFVLPSRWEGLPMVLLEALAAGRAVVVSDFASAREVLKDGQSGLVVPVGDAEALASALMRVHDDHALRARLESGGARAVLPYAIGAHVDALLALLS